MDKQPDRENRYTYQEYQNLPWEEGYRYEVLDGRLLKDPSPSRLHQKVTGDFFLILRLYFRAADPGGCVYIAPLDVVLGQETVVQPDIFYVRGNWVKCANHPSSHELPALVVEVLSPGTLSRDRIRKFQLYQDAGIQHYWLVSPEEHQVECFTLVGNVYNKVSWARGEEIMTHPAFPGLQVPLDQLWT